MVSDSTSQRPMLTLDDLALPLSRRPERLWALGASELAVAFSQALDLAEGKDVGHAQRVAYIAVAIAVAIDAGRPSKVKASWAVLMIVKSAALRALISAPGCVFAASALRASASVKSTCGFR